MYRRDMRRFGYLAAAILGVFAIAFAPSATAVNISKIIDAGGQRQWISCTGTGSPTVVFIAGLGGSASAWSQVQPSAARQTRTCVYDRPGLGKSPSRIGSTRTNAREHARELNALLNAAGETGDVILVGHSYAGLIVRSFVKQNGSRVAGSLLLDAVYPGIETNYLPSYRSDWNEGGTTINMKRSSSGAAPSFGNMPLVVITAGDPEPGAPAWVIRLWNLMQRKAAQLSTDSTHVVAVGSGHSVQVEEPKIVSRGVSQLITAMRTNSSLPPCGRPWERLGAKCLS